MIKKRKVRNQSYYKVYDSEFPFVIVYCSLEEADALIKGLEGCSAGGIESSLNT